MIASRSVGGVLALLGVVASLSATQLRGAPRGADPGKAAAPAAPGRTREFLFTYGATVKGLQPGQAARVWLPVPPSNDDQQVTAVRRDLPAEPQATVEPKYGNQLLYFEAKARGDGTLPLSVTYRVKRREIKGESRTAAAKAEEELFLKADSKVPVGPESKPMKLLEGKQLPDEALARARVFYDLVNAHMVYSKDRPGWGRGDAEWACDSRFGNCSDFHSLFISLARSHKMPAKFEMGFPVPEKRGKGDVAGYHCWAFFKPAGGGKGWVPVDISEANKVPSMKDYYFGNLTEDRVGFSVGRDLTLVPKQDGPPLNFLIYPYVEVGGKPLPPEQLDKKFSYEDVPAAAPAPAAPRRGGVN